MRADHPFEASDHVALTVREELARRRLSRQWLADEARVSLSTLEKALAGRRPFTLPTIVRIEQALKIDLRGSAASQQDALGSSPHQPMLAPPSMGAYARPAVQWLEGEYLTLRPSFSEPEAIFAYLTAIGWDEARGYLTFHETARQDSDYEQGGFVSFPHLSGHIYLVTECEGQYRIALLCRPSGGRALRGVLTTLVAGQGAQLIPAAVPIALLPQERVERGDLGVIRSGSPCYDEYRSCVDGIAKRGFALFPA